MFRYLLALFLMNSYSNNYSLGGTVPDPRSANLTNLLNALANSCENPFLVTQIKGKLNECSIIPPRPEEKLIQCMLYYDINKQLCDAVAAFKIALPGDYSGAVNAAFDVEDTCNLAQKWNFTELSQIPSYRQEVIKIFQLKYGCIKVCDVPEVTSSDTNFFCKYFMWGWKILSNIPKHPPVAVVEKKVNAEIASAGVKTPNGLPGIVANIIETAPSMTATANITAKINETSNIDSNVIKPVGLPQLVEPKVDTPTDDNKAIIPVKKENDETQLANVETKVANVETQVANVETQVVNKETQVDHEEAQVANEETQVGNEETQVGNEETQVGNEEPQVGNDETQGGNDETQVRKDSGMSANSEVKLKNSGAPLAPSVGETNALDKPSAAEVEPSKKKDALNSQSPLGHQKKLMMPVEQSDPDYNDSEEGKEGLIDGDDNADDPVIGGEMEPKPEITQPQTKNTKSMETPMSFVGEREFYPLQDQFVEDDDHFFPFFLSGIILVVLLYILYHNKNKVTKVVLGLIVEGRQPGRRRNSRGHAYKRLDTLEQAMSTNSTAPPSKIIY